MSVTVNGASKWTTTEIVTEGSSNNISIIGGTPDGSKTLSLNIGTFQPGTGSYTIFNSSAGVSTTAVYVYGPDATTFSTGQIFVTNYSTSSMQGTFELQGPGCEVTGTFIAAIP